MGRQNAARKYGPNFTEAQMWEEGKAAIKSALIGYALAALAPMFVDILRRVLAA